MKLKTYSFNQILIRLLPLLLGFFTLGAFFISSPHIAANLYSQFLSRLHLKSATPDSPPDIAQLVNQTRKDANLSTFTSQTSLNQAAQIITLSALQEQTLDSTISVDQAVQATNYYFSNIISLTGFLPQPYSLSSPEAILKQHQDTITDPDFTDSGIYQTTVTFQNLPGLLYTIILAQPSSTTNTSSSATNTPSTPLTSNPTPSYYTGVELWQAIQQYRKLHGVPEYTQDNTLCTIAAIRLNQLIELNKLDDHQGFSPLVDQMRQQGQLTHHNVAENILSGYPTPETAIQGWDSSLGHRSLMQDGAYVYGCTAANYGFAVLIAAY